MFRFSKYVLFFLLVGLAALTVGCKKEAPVPASEPVMEAAKPAGTLTADPIYAILGRADADVSGASDIQFGEDGVTVAYHYYLVKDQDFDKTFGPHIAPKIRELYAKAKEINTVKFDVSIPDLSPGVWKPRLHFAVDRKLIEETDWTKLPDIDFFQVVKDLKVFD